MPEDLDQLVRSAAFNFLAEHTRLHGETFTRKTLEEGFLFRCQQVRLVGPQGIFKPAILDDRALSLTTVAPKPGRPRPYDDGFQSDGTVVYKYRGTDPNHHNNRWVRNAMVARAPLIYFHATVPARYVAAWPVNVIGDDTSRLEFRLDVDSLATGVPLTDRVAEPDLTRRYGLVTTRQRLHQQTFRDRVLRAYREHCAVCHLKHAELLDAAHIIPDSDPDGEPHVSNGISLCKLHHAAYDRNLYGIRPDFQIIVPDHILAESDGPMLKHGLQEIHETKIVLPGNADLRPNPDSLNRRFEEFEQANSKTSLSP
jgi:putative restriction endonuclease